MKLKYHQIFVTVFSLNCLLFSTEEAPIYLEAFNVPDSEDFVEEIQVFVSGNGEVERMEIIGDTEPQPEEIYDEMREDSPEENTNIFTEIYSDPIRVEDQDKELRKEKDFNLTPSSSSALPVSHIQTLPVKSISAGGKVIAELGKGFSLNALRSAPIFGGFQPFSRIIFRLLARFTVYTSLFDHQGFFSSEVGGHAYINLIFEQENNPA